VSGLLDMMCEGDVVVVEGEGVLSDCAEVRRLDVRWVVPAI